MLTKMQPDNTISSEAKKRGVIGCKKLMNLLMKLLITLD